MNIKLSEENGTSGRILRIYKWGILENQSSSGLTESSKLVIT